MKKLLFTFLLCFVSSVGGFAAPARPVPFTVKQADGTSIEVTLLGDEHFRVFFSRDGMPLLPGADESLYYVRADDGHLVPGELLAHEENQRTEAELRYVREEKEILLSLVKTSWEKSHSAIPFSEPELTGIKSRALGVPQAFFGKKKGLVILVEFPDKKFTRDNVRADFQERFNKEGYNKDNHIGSVRDYFLSQSYGAFDFSFDVVGPVKVRNSYTYYGKNDQEKDRIDIHAGQLVLEACRLADGQVNFSDYDWDGNGKVEQVFLIYAGYGENAGAPTYTLWPHKSSLYAYAYAGDIPSVPVLDGVRVDDYAIVCELAGRSGNRINGIGTACHEFGHCFGLPDFYDTSYGGGFGMGEWDIMDAGTHNGPSCIGEAPCGYSAYERAFCGWLELKELTSSVRVAAMPPLDVSPTAYVIRNDFWPTEFFILENRQNQGWHRYVGSAPDCHGLLITHVDYAPISWQSNTVNSTYNHQRMSIVPADGDYGSTAQVSTGVRYAPTSEELRGDCFPGVEGVRSFTGVSHADVGGKLFNQAPGGSDLQNKPITHIKEKEGLIYFDFLDGEPVPAPTLLRVWIKGKDSVALSWRALEDVDTYTVEAQASGDEAVADGKVLTAEGLVDTAYVFSGLETGNYRLRVKAVRDDSCSEWSAYGEVSIGDVGIRNLRLQKKDGSLRRFYTLDGILVNPPLRQGLYILRDGDKARKILIK